MADIVNFGNRCEFYGHRVKEVDEHGSQLSVGLIVDGRDFANGTYTIHVHRDPPQEGWYTLENLTAGQLEELLIPEPEGDLGTYL